MGASKKLHIKEHLDDNPQGLYKVPDDIYFKHFATSNSDINSFLRSPRHFEHLKLLGNKSDKRTEAQTIGSAVHCLLLEPEDFDNRFAIAPDVAKNKPEYKKVVKENPGKEILKQKQFDNIEEIVGAAMGYKDAEGRLIVKDHLLKNGEPEVAMFWECPLTGRKLKGKADWIRRDGVLVDLKTTADASRVGFAKSCATYGYHRQAAHYLAGATACTGIEFNRFIFICVEKVAPFNVSIFDASKTMIEAGRTALDEALLGIQDCIKKDSFPGYQRMGIEEIDLPDWHESWAM